MIKNDFLLVECIKSRHKKTIENIILAIENVLLLSGEINPDKPITDLIKANAYTGIFLRSTRSSKIKSDFIKCFLFRNTLNILDLRVFEPDQDFELIMDLIVNLKKHQLVDSQRGQVLIIPNCGKNQSTILEACADMHFQELYLTQTIMIHQKL